MMSMLVLKFEIIIPSKEMFRDSTVVVIISGTSVRITNYPHSITEVPLNYASKWVIWIKILCFFFQYVAWHFLPPIARWTQQPGRVKRRYREFVTLQDRLEEHPKYRKSIKGIL